MNHKIVFEFEIQNVFENDIIKLGNLNIKVLHTPGHCHEHISLILDKYFFCGDVMYAMVLQSMLDYPYPTDFMAPLPGYPIAEACKRCGEASDGAGCIREAAGLLYNGTDPSRYKAC